LLDFQSDKNYCLFYQNKTNGENEMNKKQTELIEQLYDMQIAEQHIVKKRIELEEKLFDALKSEITKTEGQTTVKAGRYSIAVNQPVNYKLDEEKYRKLAETMPEELQFHRTKLDIDKFAYAKLLLTSADPSVKKYINKIQDCVTTKPGKIAIKITMEDK
jgi:Rod binding domain-containing protein